jgi:hypothetical protein
MILRDWLFGMLTISAVVIGFSSFWSSIAQNYTVQIPTNDLSLYNMTDSVASIGNQLQGNTTGIANVIQNIPILGSFASLLIAGVQAIITMLTVVPSVFLNVITNMGGLIGLPGWFTGMIITAIILMIIWSIISQAVVKGRV